MVLVHPIHLKNPPLAVPSIEYQKQKVFASTFPFPAQSNLLPLPKLVEEE